MTPTLATAIATMVVALLTTIGSLYAVRTSKAQEGRTSNREDFRVITDALYRQITALQEEVTAEKRIRKALTNYVSTLVRQMRDAGIDPARAPDEINL